MFGAGGRAASAAAGAAEGMHWLMCCCEAFDLQKDLNVVPLAFAEDGEKGDAADDLERQLRLLRAKRFLKTLAIVQDLADTLLAVNDVRGESGFLTLPVANICP